MSVRIKQDGASGENKDIFVSGRVTITDARVKELAKEISTAVFNEEMTARLEKGLGAPSGEGQTMTWASGSTYKAPSNGWVFLHRNSAMSESASSSTYFYVRIGTGTTTDQYRYQYAMGNSTLTNATIFCPVKKGDTMYFYYSNSSHVPTTKMFFPMLDGTT